MLLAIGTLDELLWSGADHVAVRCETWTDPMLGPLDKAVMVYIPVAPVRMIPMFLPARSYIRCSYLDIV